MTEDRREPRCDECEGRRFDWTYGDARDVPFCDIQCSESDEAPHRWILVGDYPTPPGWCPKRRERDDAPGD